MFYAMFYFWLTFCFTASLLMRLTTQSGAAACQYTAIVTQAAISHTGCKFNTFAFPVCRCLEISYETMR